MKNLIIISILIVVSACNNQNTNNKKNETQNNDTMTVIKNQTNMKGFKTSIVEDALANNDYRKVLYSAKHLQLVLMSLKVGEEIGEETHPEIDQFFRFESGNGKCTINGNTYTVTGGDVIIVPAGLKHNVINTDKNVALKMYTIYAPPNHQDGLIRKTKKEADENGKTFEGKTSE